jgi:hypothetical protein
MRLRLGASGAERVCALGAIGRGSPAPQLHRFRGHLAVPISPYGAGPDPAVCQHAQAPPTLGCPGNERKFVDGTFTGVFRASSERGHGRLQLELVMSYFVN